jgi:hypothetical protein
MFLNEYEIRNAADERRPGVAGRAAAYLNNYVDIVNSNSDGWAYWSAGYRASANLSAFVASRSQDEKAFRAALRPIKSLCTRHGLPYPTEQA